MDLTFALKRGHGHLGGVSPAPPLTSHASMGEQLTFPEPRFPKMFKKGGRWYQIPAGLVSPKIKW